jgi:integrase
LEQVWKDRYRKSPEQKRKVLAAWNDFKAATGAKTLRDITPELVVAYRDTVYARNVSGKSQSNLFTRIRRLLSFAKSRAIAVKEIAESLTVLELLTPSDATLTLDPKPIAVEDWRTLLAAATNEADRALLLLCLNCGMYLAEAIRLKWNNIKAGTIVTHRAKEGRVIRVAVLWAETLKAIEALPRKGEFLFYAYDGAPLGIKGAEKRFRKLRDDAKVPNVTSSMLRDGAATAMAEAQVGERLSNLVLGHRQPGMTDHYVKRSPRMVEPATEAIRKAYMTAQKLTA